LYEHDGSKGWKGSRPPGASARAWRALLCLLLFGIVSADLSAETFRDEFSSVSYANDDGTNDWNGPWMERDDDGSPNGGNVLINAGLGVLALDDNPNTDADPSAEREADLSPFALATLSFDFQTAGGVDATDSVLVEASNDGGGTWTLVEDITGVGDMTDSRSYELLSYIPALSANTRIRFRVNGLNGTGGGSCCYGGAGEEFRVDNVQIEGLCAAPPETFRDQFDTPSYTNNDGTSSWTTAWQELDDDGSPTGGNVLIDVGLGELALDDRPNSGGAPSAERQVDLSGFTSAAFSFDYRTTDGVDTNDSVVVEVSGDGGGSWTPLEAFTGIGGATSGSRSYDLTASMSTNTRVRFRVNRRYQGTNEEFRVDNVQIEAFRAVACASLPAPVAEWRLDESSWSGTPGEVVDSSGNGLDGTAFNGATAVPARVCNGVRLDGGSGTGAFIRVADDPLLDVTDELTVTAWINPDLIPSGGNLKTILSKDENYEFHLENDEVYWWWNTSGGQTRSFRTSGASIGAGSWSHIAIVYSRSRGEQKVYVNGVDMPAQAGSTTTSTEALLTNLDPLEIGADQGRPPGREFDGLIDEVKVFRSALTAAEIANVVNETRPCGVTSVAYYAMDESSWSGAPGEVVDGSGNGNHGVRVGAAQIIDPGYVCRGGDMPLNTTAGAIDAVNTGVDVDSELGNAGTIDFWFKSNQRWNGRGDRQLLDASSSVFNNANDKYFFLVLRNNGRLRFGLEDSADQDYQVESGNKNFPAGQWVHIAITWDLPGDRLQVYVDGALDGEATPNTNGTLGDVGPLYLGDNSSGYIASGGTGRSADGVIDEARLYDRVLPQAEIQTDMLATHPCPVPNVVDHYRILHDGAALTCQPESVTVQACSDANCTVLFTGAATVTLAPTGWVGGDAQIITAGQGVFELRHGLPEAVLLGIGSATPLANNPVRCFLSGVEGSCAMTFYESGFVFDVPDQVSCTASANVTLSAVRAEDTSQRCVPAFANVTRTLSLWSTYVSPAAPVNPQPLAVNGTPVATASPGTAFNLAFDANGETPISVAYQEAGRLQLEARYTGSGADAGLVMVGNDSFVYRPHSFFLGATTDGVTALGNTTDSGDPKWRAGEDFQLQVRAQCQDGTITQNYVPSGAEVFAEMINPTEAAGAAPGTLTVKGNSFSGSFLSAPLWQNISALFFQGVIVEGGQPVSGFANTSFNEAGVIKLHLRDGSYLGTAIPETVLAVGRFTPDHFETGGLQDGALSDGCGGFTYTGQEDAGRGAIRYLTAPAFTVTAKEKGGATTRNYTGGFVKLVAGGVVITPPVEDATQLGADAATRMAVTANINAGSLADNGDGTLTYTLGNDDYLYDRDANAAVGPFTSDLRLDIASATDGDGIAASDLVKTLQPVGVEIRYGRVAIQNAFGSELVDLAVPLTAQYLDAGGNYVANTLDSCTDLTLSLADVSAGDNLDVSNDTCVQDNGGPGDSGAGCVPPGPAGRQYTEPPSAGGFNLYLRPPGAGKTGSADVQVDAPTWLEFDWNGTGDVDPTGRATFGIFRGAPNIIHLREPWN
jgi:MSHA biogenesis protein MshQ